MSEEHTSLKQIIKFRMEKLQKLRDAGVNPYPYFLSNLITVKKSGRILILWKIKM